MVSALLRNGSKSLLMFVPERYCCVYWRNRAQLLLFFAFLVFGSLDISRWGRTLGRALRQFQNAQEGFNKVVRVHLTLQ